MIFSLARFGDAEGKFLDAAFLGGAYYSLVNLFAAEGGSFHGDADIDKMLCDWDASLTLLEQAIGRCAADGKLGLDVLPLDVADRGLTLTSPISRPGKVLCAAANYNAHVAEMKKSGFTGAKGSTQSEPVGELRPYHFMKASSCMVGPVDDVVLPSDDHRIDWEIELGAVVGAPAKNVMTKDALGHVAGYVIVNDVSCRAATWRADRPNIRSDWLSGKSYDTFLPIGPHLLPAKFVPDYRKLELKLWVNGDQKQSGPAGDMIFSIEQQIEYLSSMLTLESGDLIATGTPAGVGQGKGEFLKPGDIMEAEIDGLGRQKNTIHL